MAEHLHLKIRREIWGYDKSENLETSDLLSVKYQVLADFETSYHIGNRGKINIVFICSQFGKI